MDGFYNVLLINRTITYNTPHRQKQVIRRIAN